MKKYSAKTKKIWEILENVYQGTKGALRFDNPFELLVAVVLSAQSTDKRVNVITERLFPLYSTPEKFAQLNQEQLEYLIRDCGLFRMKAKNLLATSQILLEEYGGEVPRTMDELVKLPGVGRKSANVILSQAFGLPGFAVDTHVMRVSHRLGLSKGKTPEVVEKEITKTVIPELWGEAHHWLIWHGRLVCSARKPKCDECQLMEVCPKIDL